MRKYLYFTTIVLIALGLWQCARRGTPTGGPKDETPPELLLATPPSGTTNFVGNKIRLRFDEFVVTKDLRKQLIISPPMNNFPTILPNSASKWLEIRITDTLQPNTTYVLNFGNSIQDYNENNPYRDFKYVFSTGQTIDTLWYEGDVADAFEPTTDNFVTVMLYPYNEQYNDSIVYKQKPLYVTNTLDSLNSFAFEYLKEGKYKLIALKDKDNNYLFNPKSDKIGFLEAPISVHDLKGQSQGVYPKLRLFKEVLPYKASRPWQAATNRISLGYEGATHSLTVKPIGVGNDFKYVVAKDPKKDTLNIWYSPKQKDSLVIAVAHQQKVDTFRVRLRESKDIKPDSLRIEKLFSADLPMNKDFGFKSNIPLAKVDASKIKITQGKDSLAKKIDFKGELSADKLIYYLKFDKKNGERFNIQLLPKAMVDFFGHSNDSLKVAISTKPLEELSILKLAIKGEGVALQFPIILQLTDSKGKEVKETYRFEKPQDLYILQYITPAKYQLRLIEDRNGNDKWDTGNFLKHLQPERVWFLGKEMELRANWEIEENWLLKD